MALDGIPSRDDYDSSWQSRWTSKTMQETQFVIGCWLLGFESLQRPLVLRPFFLNRNCATICRQTKKKKLRNQILHEGMALGLLSWNQLVTYAIRWKPSIFRAAMITFDFITFFFFLFIYTSYLSSQRNKACGGLLHSSVHTRPLCTI